jgi:hypothetical protein
MSKVHLSAGLAGASLAVALLLLPFVGPTGAQAAPNVGKIDITAAGPQSSRADLAVAPANGPVSRPLRLAARAKRQSASDEATAAYLAKNYAKAAKLLPPLAEQGKPDAQLMLSDLYAAGNGVQADNIAAYKWTYLASTNADAIPDTHETALKSLDELSRRMSEDDVKVAIQQATDWQPTAGRPAGAAPTATENAPAAPAAASAPEGERKPESGRRSARKHHAERSRRADRSRGRTESIIRRYIGSGAIDY